MKINKQNLEKLEYRYDKGMWQHKNYCFYIYKESCKNCGEPFLACKGNKGDFCSKSCANSAENNPKYWLNKNNPMQGRKHSKKTKQKISKSMSGKNHPMYGKKRPEHSERMKGENHYFYGKTS